MVQEPKVRALPRFATRPPALLHESTRIRAGSSISKGASVTNASKAALSNLDDMPSNTEYRNSVPSTLTTDHVPVVAVYSLASAIGAPDDFDHSGIVNAADYDLWRSTFGSTTNLVADENSHGVVDASDYLTWRTATGGVASGSLADATAAAPNRRVAFWHLDAVYSWPFGDVLAEISSRLGLPVCCAIRRLN
jgi:hypothetical protein